MKNDKDTPELLRSIRNALWMIVAILLIQLGFHLVDLRRSPFAEIIMLFSFWGGFGLLFCMLISALARPFIHASSDETQAEQAAPPDGDKPSN